MVSASTIAQVYTDAQGGNGTASYQLTGTVTDIISTNSTINVFTFQDSTGSILFYRIAKSVFTPVVGDNYTVNATDDAFENSPEIANAGFSLDSTNSTGNTVTPTVLTIPQFNASDNGTYGVAPNSEALVELENVYLPSGTNSLATFTSYNLSDGSNTAVLYTYTSYTQVSAAVTAANGEPSGFLQAPLDIIGYSDPFYSASSGGEAELYPIAFIAVPEPASVGLLAGAAFAIMHRRARRMA